MLFRSLLIAIGLIVLSWGLLYRGRRNIRLLQGTMILFVLSGLVGLFLHYQGNAEFELEMYPSLKGLELYVQLFVPMNLNTTAEEDFLLVPGVGSRLAHEFEEYRPYQAMAQFRREIGKYVDEEEVARLEQYVFVPINLNTASDEEILTIPGVGPKLLHEFKEYRPYDSIEQFRREIGKYVSEEEVSRLERYVTL